MPTICYGLNLKRLIPAIVAVYGFIFATDFCIHGIWLAQTYGATAHLWRPVAEMQSYMAFMMLGQFLVSAVPTIIFAKGYEGKGIAEGVRFGLLIGSIGAGYSFVQYAVFPLTCYLLGAWVFSGFAQAIGAGVLMSLIYRKSKTVLG